MSSYRLSPKSPPPTVTDASFWRITWRSESQNKSAKLALDQKFDNFEVLLIDDGSTDDTRQAVSEIKDSRLRYIYKTNSGVSSARNLGIKNATGEFICFLDSDDLWPENFLQTMIKSLQGNSEYGAESEVLQRPHDSRICAGDMGHQVVRPGARVHAVSAGDR